MPIDVSVASVASVARAARWHRWWRSGWPPLLAALGCAGAYAVFFALPYYVNHLDGLPLAELTAGAHDPRTLWPHDGGDAWAFGLATTATFLAGPAATLGVLAWAVVRTRDGITAGDLRRTGPALVAAAVSIGTVAWLFSPLGRALTAWSLD